jgi:uncharacterized protein (TIGR02594 family)
MTWFDIAEAELGQAEVPGAGDNPRITEYFAGAGHPEVVKDSVPWCAGFVGWCLAQDGIDGTGSLMAKSYLRWGEALQMPRKGCVVVMQRGNDPASGHVGFFHSKAGNRVMILGGNQGDKVSLAGFPVNMVLSYRWPATVKAPAPTATEQFAAHDELEESSWWYTAKGWGVKLLGGGGILGAGSAPHWSLKPIDIALIILGVAAAAIVGIELLRLRQRGKLLGGQS